MNRRKFVRFTPKSGHVRRKKGCPLCAKSGHRPPPLLLQWCNYDRCVKHDWFFARGGRNKDFDGPISSLRQINSINLPRSIGLADCCLVNGQWARVWWVELNATSLVGNSEKSSRSTRIRTLTCPTRPGSTITSAMASGAWMCTKAASGGIPSGMACLCAAGGSVPRTADAQQDAETKTDLRETVAL